MELLTPDMIVAELVSVRAEAQKGVVALMDAETKLAEKVREYDTIRAHALLNAKGTVVDREALATLAAEQAKFDMDIARAELNRVKMKLRLLQDAQTNIQSQARMVELTYKTAGIGER